MKRVILTENQLFLIKNTLNPDYLVREFKIQFKNTFINEDNVRNLPHKAIAVMLSRGFKYGPNAEKIKCKKYRFIGKNPFDKEDDGRSNSYYFEMIFEVDNEEKIGLLRISDHKASSHTFDGRGYHYCLSIVFETGLSDIGRRDFANVTIYEYVTNCENPNVREIMRNITNTFLKSDQIKIVHGKVVSPSIDGVEFKRAGLQKQDKVSEPKEYKLITTKPSVIGELTDFYTSDKKIHVTAIRKRNSYKLDNDSETKFNIGDTVIFYEFTENDVMPVEKNAYRIE